MATQSRSEHVLQLARELLDDIELSRTNAENLILKASRLARWGRKRRSTLLVEARDVGLQLNRPGLVEVHGHHGPLDGLRKESRLLGSVGTAGSGDRS